MRIDKAIRIKKCCVCDQNNLKESLSKCAYCNDDNHHFKVDAKFEEMLIKNKDAKLY